SLMTPRLTTIRQDSDAMGVAALKVIVGLMKKEKVPLQTIVPGILVKRDTTGPAPEQYFDEHDIEKQGISEMQK
ncbi:MAG: substrate-binding domain-containing protein, partial [Victivallaceae bacterium]|nr:substrate-binding domain-containing protein [Victivallaceae bacterium]